MLYFINPRGNGYSIMIILLLGPFTTSPMLWRLIFNPLSLSLPPLRLVFKFLSLHSNPYSPYFLFIVKSFKSLYSLFFIYCKISYSCLFMCTYSVSKKNLSRNQGGKNISLYINRQFMFYNINYNVLFCSLKLPSQIVLLHVVYLYICKVSFKLRQLPKKEL